MHEISVSALSGKVDAIGAVLNLLLIRLTPAQAAEMAAQLADEQQAVRDTADPGTPEEEIASQQLVLGAYLQLLTAVAERGR